MKKILFILLVLVKNLECVEPKTANYTINRVMFLPLKKTLAFEDSGTDAVVRFVIVYEDGVAYIPCQNRKEQKNETQPMFINKVTTELFQPVFQEEGQDRLIIEGNNIVIYHVKLSDAGIYQFSISENDCVVVLEVIAYEKRHVFPTHVDIGFEDKHRLLVYSLWSPWSECSVCGEVGKKRRFGMCYVKNKKGYPLIETSKRVLEAFTDGMPCRSQFLPPELKRLPALIMGKNKIEISRCMVQVPCKDIIFETSLNGTVLERANNSAGIYSLKQPLPQPPPPPGREIVFAPRGQPLLVRCPGFVNRDVPLRWRVGRRWLNADGFRVHVNGRDDLIIETVTDEDDNLYSCWAGRRLLGSVRVAVRGGARPWDHHCALAALIVLMAALLRSLVATLYRIT